MARVPEQEIERLKRDVSVVRLAEARGVKLSGSGDNLMGLCPFHDDREPSLVVSPSKNVWHCLGACKAGGSVIDWVMRAEKTSFRLAVELLRKGSPTFAAERPQPGTRAKLSSLAEPSEPDAVVLRRVVAHYHATLKESPEALAYLESRGLKDREMLDHFQLGYANRTLGYRLPQKQVSAGDALRTQLARIGVYRESGHEHLAGSLVIPVFGEDGEVLELYGRKLRDDLRKGTPKHLYLPSRADGRRGVFNLAGVRASREVIVCEALIDALTFWCAGYRNVTSAYGVEGVTSELRAALTSPQVERVLIAYDRDEAGDRGAEALTKVLEAADVSVYRVRFPKGMDANEYAQKVTPASRSLETAIRGAEWICGTRRVSMVGLEAMVPEESVARAHVVSPPPTTEPRTSEAVVSVEAIAAASSVEAAAPSDPTEPVEPIEIVELAPASVATMATAVTASSSPAPSPTPAPPASTGSAAEAEPGVALDVEVRAEEVRIRIGSRQWRARGLSKNTSYESLRVTLQVAQGPSFFVDTVELYSARHRAAYLKQASEELSVEEKVLKGDLGRIVRRLEELVHEQLSGALSVEKRVEMSEEERRAALELLRDPRLLDRVLEDFEKTGVVGEETNKLMGYLAGVSRKLESPLAVVIQSSSAAGKSSLMDAVLRFMPEEERVQYSAMTGQSLFYMGETDLAHKILAIAEEEGAQSASYALKLLQSEGELTIASTGKDATTGRLVTQEYRVKGPVMIFLTTTAIEVDEELLNRCIVLTVDEGSSQTTAIHAKQRSSQTLAGLLARQERSHVCALHQNAQRLLEPLLVANPWAEALRFASHTTRTRRDHMKYLTLIRAIALVHQHQREVKTVEHRGKSVRYIEVTREDIARADALASVALGHGLDELPPQTRRLLELVTSWVMGRAKSEGVEASQVRFSRKDVRELTRWSHTVLRKHLERLEELEHLVVHGGRRQVVYELSSGYDDRPGSPEGPFGSPVAPQGRPAGSPVGSPQTERESKGGSGRDAGRGAPVAGAHLERRARGGARSESYVNGAAR